MLSCLWYCRWSSFLMLLLGALSPIRLQPLGCQSVSYTIVVPFSYPFRQTSASSLKTRSIQENTNTVATDSGNSSAPNFGKCSTPEIKFAKGLDNRKETAFEPVDLSSRHSCAMICLLTFMVHSLVSPWLCTEHRHHLPVCMRLLDEHLWGQCCC